MSRPLDADTFRTWVLLLIGTIALCSWSLRRHLSELVEAVEALGS